MKKLLAVGALFLTLVSTNVFAVTKVSNQRIVLDKHLTDVRGYNIDDKNYFKLRDIAALLADTDKSFDVKYHEGTNTIHIYREKDYKKVSDDLKPLKDSEKDPINSTQNVFVDGQKVTFNSYSIDGYNYFQLRQIGRVVGFIVDFDEEENNVLIDTSRYIPPRPLVNNFQKINVATYVASSYDGQEDILKRGELDIKDFFANIESGILVTNNQERYSGESYYVKEKDVVVVHPIQAMYSGTFRYTPFIKIKQDDKEDVFKYNDKFEVAKTLKSRGFDPTAEFEISLGTKSDDGFVVYSTFNYK